MVEPMDNAKKIKSHAERNAEYFESLEKWLDDVRTLVTCNLLSGFPFAMMSPAAPHGMTPPMGPFTVPPIPPPAFPRNLPQFQVNQPEEFVEYQIPPLWKRFCAEFIDFFILFFMKLAITFIAVDFFDFIDLDKYDLASLQNGEKVDYQWAVEMTTEILMLEFIHRLIVCTYEGCSLAQQAGDQRGGATPGKIVMGLRVVSCRLIVQGPTPTSVRVCPAATLGMGQSIARALLKNLVLAFLFPICFPLFFNKHNRTGYDIICRCIVVEDARPGAPRFRR